ncbi:MAG: ABC transporter substrate-binding protein [Chloroflexi bacterium]|nr:ABC transporter substrate-binding protein [Chloroflexota bacterium]
MPAPLNPVAKVRYGDLANTSDGPTYVAIEKGYFKEQGIEVELTNFQSGAKMITSLAAGQLDVGGGAVSVGLYNAFARGINIKVVADRAKNGPGHDFNTLAIRKDLADRVKDFKDLKGFKIAVSGIGAAGHAQLGAALAKGGLTTKDIDMIEMPWPDMLVALSNKAIDGGILSEPFSTQAVEKGFAVIFKRVHPDIYPDHQVGVLMYSPQFADSRPQVAKQFVMAYIKGIRAYMDGFDKNVGKDEIIKILTQHTPLKDPAIYNKIRSPGFDRNGYVRVEHLVKDQDYYVQEGLIKPNEKANIDKLVDNSYVEYALSILGKQ